jgi:flagellar motor switch protein FliM
VQQILSRDEISALTTAFGKVARVSKGTHEVRAYDFTRPDKLSKSKLRAAERLFAGLGHAWSETASGALRTDVAVKINSVEEVTLRDYADALPEPSVIAVIRADQGGHAYLDMQGGQLLVIANRLAGGRGEIHQRRAKLTHIEQVLLKLFAGRLSSDLSLICSRSKPAQFSVTDIRQSADDLGDSDDMLVAVGIDWRMDGREYRVNLALPSSLIEQIADSPAEKKSTCAQSNSHTVDPQSVEAMLGPVPVPVAADLGHARVTVKELRNMEVGDVIKLDHQVSQPINIKIGKQTAFGSHVGLMGETLALQINSGTSDPGTVIAADSHDNL